MRSSNVLLVSAVALLLVSVSLGQIEVDTSRTPEGKDRTVRVGIPFIVDLNLLRSNTTSWRNTKMDLGVLGGFVKVNLDRTRDAQGKRGPVSVSIFGQKVYGDRRRRR